MNKVKKIVSYIRENDRDKNIQTYFSSVCYIADRDLEIGIIDTNGRFKSYCSNN